MTAEPSTDDRFEALTRVLGAAPDACWHAPGRVNLIGDHTDYCEGFVLPMAIDLDCLVAVRAAEGDVVSARSLELDGHVQVPADASVDPAEVQPDWGRFVAGVVRALTERGARLRGCDLVVASTVPPGSGLSSSSALSVALTLALAHTDELALDARETARTALAAEVLATGVPGGLMDQITALMGEAGRALLVDCRSLDVEPIALPHDLRVLVVHSGLPRTLAGSEYAERRDACEAAAARLGVRTLRDATLDRADDDPYARHVVTENDRVLRFASGLRDGELDELGALLVASHVSLRDDVRVSTPELDVLVELLVGAGALGARLTGAGFGGCVVALARAHDADDVLDEAMRAYRRVTAVEPDGFVAHAVAGAGRVLFGR